MLEVIICVVLSFFVALHDLKYKTLPHWLMLPVIGGSLVYFHNVEHYVSALVLLTLGMVAARHVDDNCNKSGIWAAGDAKLFAMYGAFFGIKGLIIFVMTACVVFMIRRKHIPVAPLSFPFVLMMLM